MMALVLNNAGTSITLTRKEIIILFPVGMYFIFNLIASKILPQKYLVGEACVKIHMLGHV